MEVTHKRKYSKFSIYIDGILHFSMKEPKYRTMQAWLNGEKHKRIYVIEIYLKGIKPVRLEYTERDLWEKILCVFDKYL